MKKILYLLVMSIMVLSVGMVSAAVDFISPVESEHISSDSVAVSWENGTFEVGWLKYKQGFCDGNASGDFVSESVVSGEGSETWDISSLDDGGYCLKLTGTLTIFGSINVTIDNSNPTAEFLDTPYHIVNSNPVNLQMNFSDSVALGNYSITFGDTNLSTGSLSGLNDLVNVSHIYAIEGEYTVTVTVEDQAGNAASESTIVIVTSDSPDWIIELDADGMNMFSIPLMPESSDIEDVLPERVSDKAEKIWSYQKGGWKYNTPTASGWTTTSTRIQEIVPGYGYILFMDEDTVMYGDGKDLGADTPPEVTLTTGWNLIGHYGLNDTLTSTQALDSLQLGANYYWNSLLTVDNNGDLQSVSTVEPNEAYWLSIKGIDLEDEDELRFFIYSPSQFAY